MGLPIAQRITLARPAFTGAERDVTPSPGPPRSMLPDTSPCGRWTLLSRHGQRPLGFNGRLLFEASDRTGESMFWSCIAVHEADGGAYVAQIVHASSLLGLPHRCFAFVCATAEAVLEVFETHDPLAALPADALTYGLPTNADAGGLLAHAKARAAAYRAGWRALLFAVFKQRSAPVGPGSQGMRA